MKTILFILMLFSSSIISSQITDNELNSYTDNSKDKIYAIDHNFQYLKTTVKEGNASLIGHYNFALYKVTEIENSNERIYYYWNDIFFSVYDGKIKKQLFFKGDFKNASEKMFDFYKQRAELYKAKFDNYLISPIIKVFQNSKLIKFSDTQYSQDYKGRYDQTKFNNFKCIIPETSGYSVVNYSLSYAGNGIDGELKVNDCSITDNVRKVCEKYNLLFLNIKLKDKKSGSVINLPNIVINK